ncbi:MAG: amidohydrolase family protein [Propionibacteriales bacterium]|nr:amidohydrolase family protein [Propionibacteriales bacterium]
MTLPAADPRCVDVHCHVVVPELLRSAAPGETWRPDVRRDAQGQIVEIGGRRLRSAVGEIVDVEAILEAQRSRGVDGVVLSPFVPLLYAEAEPEVCLERCRLQNEGLAGMVRAHPDAVSAVGAVPMQDPELAAGELRALMDAGTLSGVEITASVRGTYLGDDRFEPVWQAAEESGALVFVHPTTSAFDAEVFSQYYLWNAVGNPVEVTIAAAHLVLSGVLERHPDLRILLSHGGGAVTGLRGRLRHAHANVAAAGTRLAGAPEDSLRRLHFDTVVHDRDVLAALVDFAGHDRVVLGSDHPFDMGDPDPAGSVRRLGMEPVAEESVLGGNARRLIRRWS